MCIAHKAFCLGKVALFIIDVNNNGPYNNGYYCERRKNTWILKKDYGS